MGADHAGLARRPSLGHRGSSLGLLPWGGGRAHRDDVRGRVACPPAPAPRCSGAPSRAAFREGLGRVTGPAPGRVCWAPSFRSTASCAASIRSPRQSSPREGAVSLGVAERPQAREAKAADDLDDHRQQERHAFGAPEWQHAAQGGAERRRKRIRGGNDGSRCQALAQLAGTR